MAMYGLEGEGKRKIQDATNMKTTNQNIKGLSCLSD